jgi:hypothetical protein
VTLLHFHDGDRAAGPLVVTAGAALATAFALAETPLVFALAAAVAVSLLGLGLSLVLLAPAGTPGGARLRHWTWAAFVVHALLSVLIGSSQALTTTFGGDADTYHQGALGIVEHWSAGSPLPPVIAIGKEGFFYALASVYYVLGPYRLAAVVLNAALSAAVLPVIFDTTRRLFGERAAQVSVVMLAVLPGFLVWTSQLLREAPILLGLAVAANAAVRLTDRLSAGAFVTLAGVAALLFTLRANVALVVLGALLASVALGRRDLVAGLGTGAAAMGLAAVLVFSAGVGYAGFQRAAASDLAEVSLARQDLSNSAQSGYAPDRDVSSSSAVVAFLPVALVHFAFGPFLAQADNARQLAGGLEALTLWVLFPSLVRGCHRGFRLVGRRSLVLVLPALAISCSLAILLGNYGTIVRERLQVTIFLVPLAAYGWTLRRPRGRVAERPAEPVEEPSAA